MVSQHCLSVTASQRHARYAEWILMSYARSKSHELSRHYMCLITAKANHSGPRDMELVQDLL